MKQEFNFQGLDRARTAMKVAALALPALGLLGYQYRPAGLALTAVIATWMGTRRMAALAVIHHDSHARRLKHHSSPVYETDLTQQIGNNVAARFGIPTTPVFVGRKRDELACTNRYNIHIHVDLALKLNEDQMAWVIAHETDHIRNPKDDLLTLPLTSSAKGSAALGLLAAVGAMTQTLFIPGNPSLISSLSVSAAASTLLYLSAKTVHRAIERRCDANALRATGNLEAGLETLKIADRVAEPFPVDTKFGMAMRGLLYPFYTHPTTEDRIAHLEKTWAVMQTEKIRPPNP